VAAGCRAARPPGPAPGWGAERAARSVPAGGEEPGARRDAAPTADGIVRLPHRRGLLSPWFRTG